MNPHVGAAAVGVNVIGSPIATVTTASLASAAIASGMGLGVRTAQITNAMAAASSRTAIIPSVYRKIFAHDLDLGVGSDEGITALLVMVLQDVKLTVENQEITGSRQESSLRQRGRRE